MRWRAAVFRAVVLALLVPALAVTTARVVEPLSEPWLLLEGLTPLAIPLYAGASVLLGVRLAVVRRPWTWAAAAVALAGLLGHGWWFAPQVTGANPAPADGADPLVVMTANIAGSESAATDVVRHAAAEQVDLLVVEEITDADLAAMDRSGLGELLPHRAGTPADNGDGTMVFARAGLGQPRPVPTVHEGWLVPLGDLTVLAVHPWAPTDPGAWRADHATVLRAAVDGDADLVVGDLNATDDHAPVRALADAGFRDAGELANDGWQPTWPASGMVSLLGVPVPSVAQIDHVLVGPRLAAIGTHRLEIAGTDHRAMVAEVAPR